MDFFIRGEYEPQLVPSIVFMNYTLENSLIIHHVMPENVAITPSNSSFETYNIPGRSSPSAAYAGGDSRSISFTLNLHRDLFEASNQNEAGNKFQEALDWFDALNYPIYSSSGVVPPYCSVKINNAQTIKGYAQASYELKPPLDGTNRFMVADVSFTITEVLNTSWDAREIAEGCVSRKEVSRFR